VAGLVLDRLGRIPSPGDSVELDGCRIEVVDMRGWAVTAILLAHDRPPAPPAPADDDEAVR
ncbi:MAG: transporter associated domain-containing protein, partial [Acidimicrobiales bacterium]